MIVANASPDSAVLTKAEAAEFLKVKPRTVDDWMRKKRIPFAKLPSGTVRFRRSQLLDFIAKYEVEQCQWRRFDCETKHAPGARITWPRLCNCPRAAVGARQRASGPQSGAAAHAWQPARWRRSRGGSHGTGGLLKTTPLCGSGYQNAGALSDNSDSKYLGGRDAAMKAVQRIGGGKPARVRLANAA